MIVGLKFRENGQIYYFSSELSLSEGNAVIVETEQGLGFGHVTVVRQSLPSDVDVGINPLLPILRIASAEECQIAHDNRQLVKEAFAFCKQCIHERQLEMKLVDVEVFFDKSKLLFYFTAPSRIDFRELVKDLVREYRTRIELRQIGVRHETQMLGAVGSCGMVCCCRQYLRKFAPVTIRMAKEQSLFLNPAKISGICGRLLCCLSYEQENYDNFHAKCPKVGRKYHTAQGALRVLRSNLFRNSVTLLNDKNEEIEMSLEEWESIIFERSEIMMAKGKSTSQYDDVIMVHSDNIEDLDSFDEGFNYEEERYTQYARKVPSPSLAYKNNTDIVDIDDNIGIDFDSIDDSADIAEEMNTSVFDLANNPNQHRKKNTNKIKTNKKKRKR